jgi:hypothetical protein
VASPELIVTGSDPFCGVIRISLALAGAPKATPQNIAAAARSGLPSFKECNIESPLVYDAPHKNPSPSFPSTHIFWTQVESSLYSTNSIFWTPQSMESAGFGLRSVIGSVTLPLVNYRQTPKFRLDKNCGQRRAGPNGLAPRLNSPLNNRALGAKRTTHSCVEKTHAHPSEPPIPAANKAILP